MPALAWVTVSPSSSRINRRTPWVEGCCGPMLITIRWSWCSRMSSVRSDQSCPVTVYARDASVVMASPPGRPGSGGAPRSAYAGARADVGSSEGPPLVGRSDGRAVVLDRDAAEGVVLALRVSLPVVRHQDPGERWVAVEDDPDHVVRLALVPVQGRVDRDPAGDVRVAVGGGRLDPDPAVQSHREQVVDRVQLGGVVLRV